MLDYVKNNQKENNEIQGETQNEEYSKETYYRNTKRKEDENQVVCSIKQALELMNPVSCGLWPGENEQFR